jgi:glycosyltransferase involved in cell wall biosynthesis
LVRVDDISALTAALERLIADSELRESLANEARLTVERCFSIPVVLPQIVNLYEDMIRIARKKAS